MIRNCVAVLAPSMILFLAACADDDLFGVTPQAVEPQQEQTEDPPPSPTCEHPWSPCDPAPARPANPLRDQSRSREE